MSKILFIKEIKRSIICIKEWWESYVKMLIINGKYRAITKGYR